MHLSAHPASRREFRDQILCKEWAGSEFGAFCRRQFVVASASAGSASAWRQSTRFIRGSAVFLR